VEQQAERVVAAAVVWVAAKRLLVVGLGRAGRVAILLEMQPLEVELFVRRHERRRRRR
jgi:hypothetical protein